MRSSYTQDVEFNSAFSSLQTPTHLFTASVLCGHTAPPINKQFRYLDLACGNGHTLLLLADAYPHAKFVGIDINPAHISDANQRAQRAELNNVSFIESDIANLGDTTFDPFDYIAVSGVYSWLDAERRRTLLGYLARSLTDNGLIYIDYSCLPGMTQAASLYQMIQRIGAQQSGSSAERLSASTKVVSALRNSGARFFEQNDAASQRFDGMLKNPPSDEAHEVFNLQGSGFWSCDVINTFAQNGLRFLGSSGLHHNVAAFKAHTQLPEDCRALDTATQQMMLDVAWNMSQRKDLYINQQNRGAINLQQTLGELPIYTAPGALTADNRANVSKGYPGVDFCTPANDKLVQSLTQTSTFGELFVALQAEGIESTEAENLITNMLAARLISVAVNPFPNQISADEQPQKSLQMTSKLNLSILNEDIVLEHARPFASPTAGTKVALPLRDRLYLWALINGDVGSAWDQMGELVKAFTDEQGKPVDRDRFIAVINRNLENFRQTAVPELIRLGILKINN